MTKTPISTFVALSTIKHRLNSANISEHSIQQRSNASMTICRFVTAHR